jgi:hypothetical protein
MGDRALLGDPATPDFDDDAAVGLQAGDHGSALGVLALAGLAITSFSGASAPPSSSAAGLVGTGGGAPSLLKASSCARSNFCCAGVGLCVLVGMIVFPGELRYQVCGVGSRILGGAGARLLSRYISRSDTRIRSPHSFPSTG